MVLLAWRVRSPTRRRRLSDLIAAWRTNRLIRPTASTSRASLTTAHGVSDVRATVRFRPTALHVGRDASRLEGCHARAMRSRGRRHRACRPPDRSRSDDGSWAGGRAVGRPRRAPARGAQRDVGRRYSPRSGAPPRRDAAGPAEPAAGVPRRGRPPGLGGAVRDPRHDPALPRRPVPLPDRASARAGAAADGSAGSGGCSPGSARTPGCRGGGGPSADRVVTSCGPGPGGSIPC